MQKPLSHLLRRKGRSRKRRAPESDDEESEEEQSDAEEGSEDESDDDEQWYTARAVIRRKGKGKSLRYLVDWEPETDVDGNNTQAWDTTWERPKDSSYL